MRPSKEPVITAAQIRDRTRELATQIADDYAGKDLVLVAVLKGAFVFAGDLMRAMGRDVEADFIRARSYDGTSSAGAVEFLIEPTTILRGRHVLIVEDVLDTGITAAAIYERIRAQEPASVAMCTLLDKPSRRQATLDVDYVGFVVDDRFVVGYGMDYYEQFRQLPDIHVLED